MEFQALGSEPDQLPNMAWWDSVSYDSLQDWVPTMGTVPESSLHAVARLKGALCKAAQEAKAAGDEPGRKRAWKALTFIDRLLFASARQKGSGRTRADVVTGRIRQAWRGDWAALWRECLIDARGQGRGRRSQGQALAADVRAIESHISEGLLSKAVARAKGLARVDASPAASAELGRLFPPGAPLSAGDVPAAIAPSSGRLFTTTSSQDIANQPWEFSWTELPQAQRGKWWKRDKPWT